MKRSRNADDDAQSIIRRAAALIKDRHRVCRTPGARYKTRIADNYIFCAVKMPEGINPGETLDRRMYLAEHWEELIHDMMQNAVAAIIKDCQNNAHIK